MPARRASSPDGLAKLETELMSNEAEKTAQKKANLRLALILFAVAAAFFGGIVLRFALLGG